MRHLLLILSIIVSTACSFSAHVKQPGTQDTIKKVNVETPANVKNRTADVTYKQVLRADPQWNSVANEVVSCINKMTENSSTIKKHGIYVAKPDSTAPEIKAFRSLVLTKLVQNGFSVTFKAKDSYHLNYDVIPNNTARQITDDNARSIDSSSLEVMVRVTLIYGEKILSGQGEITTLADNVRRENFLRVVKAL